MRVFDTPGHTRGHVTYWLPEAKALFPGGGNASLHAHTELLHVKPQRDAEKGWILDTPCGEAWVCVAAQHAQEVLANNHHCQRHTKLLQLTTRQQCRGTG